MNYLYELFPENLLYALGWTVVHSIWQGILIAVVLAFALLSMEQKTAKARYVMSNLGLLSLLLMSVVTFCFLYQEAPALSLEDAFILEGNAKISDAGFWENMTNYFNRNLPLIVTVWLMGAVFFMLKMLGGLLYIQHLKNNQNQPIAAFWQQKMAAIAQKIPLEQSVALVESALVKVPMVVGYLKPMILLPIGAVNALTEEQVEAILAHELAHIYRNDYLLNILQTFVETLFYFHPAVWWICGNIRLERENCCDDLAVELCGNPLNYAKALVSLQEMHAEAPALAMAFSNQKNQLLHRVQRILKQPQSKSNIMEKLMATTLFVVLMIMISFGATTPLANILQGKNFSKKIEIEVEELEDISVMKTANGQTIIATFIKNDSIPKNKTTHRQTYIHTENGRKNELVIENDEVIKVVIEGKEIPPSDYAKYEKEVAELRENIGNVPAPPAPPTPPTPPAPNGMIPPLPPPAPIAPNGNRFPGFSFSQSSKMIVTEKDEDGNTVIVIDENAGDNTVEIKIETGKDGKEIIIINGEKMETLGENDRIIWEKTQPNALLFDGANRRLFELDEAAATLDFPEYFALGNEKGLENLQYYFHIDKEAPHFDFSWIDGQNFSLLDEKGSDSKELLRWKERFQAEMDERKRDGNFSQEWLNKKQAEAKKQFPKHLLVVPDVYNFEFPKPEFENHYQWLPSPEILKREELPRLEKFYENIFFKDLQKELILDGLIKDGELYKLELSEKEFKLNGKKQSDKQLKKYLKLLEKQQKARLKLKSKLS